MRVIAELEREIEIHPNQSYKPEEAIPCMIQWPLQAADRAVEGTVSEEPVDALCPQIEQLKVDNGSGTQTRRMGRAGRLHAGCVQVPSATLILRPFAPSQCADGN